MKYAMAGLMLLLCACGDRLPCGDRSAATQADADVAREKVEELREADLQKVRMAVVEQCKAKGRALNMIDNQIYCQDK